ncbi:hypothetical protein BX600DRAFT_457316 [Xylariales sp. PMI_506]|nr:hypothetical protein BX600DRAFT_457316 [Xylariales sp. PMI_506]
MSDPPPSDSATPAPAPPTSDPAPPAAPVYVYYTIDPNTNPSTWHGQLLAKNHGRGHMNIYKVQVFYININGASNFDKVFTGTNQDLRHALLQVAKHVARCLYRVISLNVSEYSCVVVMSTDRSRDELMWKNGFPWDRDDDPQPDVVLKWNENISPN